MAQVVKLKRSSTAAKVPSTSDLALGELAMNTNDGKIYFEKNDGSATIQTIVTTDSQTTGSIELTGAVTASAFNGDGSALTNVEATDPNAVVFGSGYLRIPDMVKAGILMNLFSIIFVALMVFYILPILWGIDPGNFKSLNL